MVVVDQVGNMWEQEEKQTRAGKGVFWVAPPPFIKTFIWWPELLNVFPAGGKSFCLEAPYHRPGRVSIQLAPQVVGGITLVGSGLNTPWSPHQVSYIILDQNSRAT